MVVDDGFDPSVAELSDKVVASHTIGCDQSSNSADGGVEAGADPLAEGANSNFDQAHSDPIAALQEHDHSCWLRRAAAILLAPAQAEATRVDGLGSWCRTPLSR
jgi:hypothetical protein